MMGTMIAILLLAAFFALKQWHDNQLSRMTPAQRKAYEDSQDQLW